MSSDAPAVRVSRAGRVLLIEIDRPERRNAVNEAVARGVAAALDQLEADEDLRVGVLTGAGGDFCAGMDLHAFVGGEDVRAGGRGFAGIVERPGAKPLIAAVEGYALGGGLEVALACDIVVAGASARVGFPEVRRGLIAAGGGLVRIAEHLPLGRAKELALTGRMLGASEAAQWGLFAHVVDAGAAVDAALQIAAQIADNAPLAVAATKQILDEVAGWAPEARFAHQQAIADAVRSSDDAAEGARAFAEKRPPRWSGA